jgi:hypothetical protein
MFQPSTQFSFNNIIQTKKLLPDTSPEAKISEQDHKKLRKLVMQVINRTMDYLIINVQGSGANLPVRTALFWHNFDFHLRRTAYFVLNRDILSSQSIQFSPCWTQHCTMSASIILL